ncbi:MAG: hypothetical protein AAGA17_00280 [Actinomycetota bacterium]
MSLTREQEERIKMAVAEVAPHRHVGDDGEWLLNPCGLGFAWLCEDCVRALHKAGTLVLGYELPVTLDEAIAALVPPTNGAAA